MIEQYAQSLAHFLQSNPSWGGIITFLVAFLESLAIVGTIIPGSVTMTAIGMLIGASILPFSLTLLWATFGAFAGDLIGYWLGSYYNERLRRMWPFNKHPQWLEAGESFFHKHGGKSIIIGRFFGPLRSIIPLIAGLLHMPLKKFIIAALPAACLWAFSYMLPGILLGALSTQLPPKVATQFILILLGFIVLLSFFAWLVNLFSTKIRKRVARILKKYWLLLLSQPRYDFFTHSIANRQRREDHQQLGWFLIALLSFIVFIIISINVFEHTAFTAWNRPLYEFLRSIRGIPMDRVMIGITLLGDGRVLSVSALFCFVWLLVHHNKREAVYWLIAVCIGLTISPLFKAIFYFPRPTGLLHASSTSSFPSGHTFFSTLFYGFFVLLIGTHLKVRYRRYPYYIASLIIFLVAFSRLYLGAHWLSDIVGSWCLGYGCLACVILAYRRDVRPMSTLHFSLFGLVITLLVWASYFIVTYEKNVLRYSLKWPTQVVDENAWWGHLNPALPIYRQNRIGKPEEPMNLQFSGDIHQLKRILVSEGWTANPNMTLLSNTIQKLSHSETVTPVLPSLYLNKAPLLYMMKARNHSQLVLKIWRSNVYLSETWDVLYVGNIAEYQIDHKRDKILYSYNVIGKLQPYLNTNEWRMTVVGAKVIPSKLFIQRWNGEILQISAPTLY